MELSTEAFILKANLEDESAIKLADTMQSCAEICENTTSRITKHEQLRAIIKYGNMLHKDIPAVNTFEKDTLRKIIKYCNKQLPGKKVEDSDVEYKVKESDNEKSDTENSDNREHFENDHPLPRGKSRSEPDAEPHSEYKELCSLCLKVSVWRSQREFNHSCKHCRRSENTEGQGIRVVEENRFQRKCKKVLFLNHIEMTFIEREYDSLLALKKNDTGEFICAMKC